jgi:hypothetical protein
MPSCNLSLYFFIAQVMDKKNWLTKEGTYIYVIYIYIYVCVCVCVCVCACVCLYVYVYMAGDVKV